jgi:hypothetical protein
MIMRHKKNPFAVLGLSPDAICSLSDEEIGIMVFAVRKALLQIHHPDKGGDQAKFIEIERAAADLNQDTANYELYLHHKSKFLKKTSAQNELASIIVQRDKALMDIRLTGRSLIAYMAAAVEFAPGVLNVFSIFGKKLRIRCIDLRDPDSPCLISPGKVFDLHARGKAMPKDGVPAMYFNDYAFLSVERDGLMIQKLSDQVQGRKRYDKRLIGTISRSVITKHFISIKRFIAAVTEKSTAVTALLPGYSARSLDLKHVVNKITSSKMEGFAYLLKPEICFGDLLIAINHSNGEVYFTIEGVAMEGEKPEKHNA